MSLFHMIITKYYTLITPSRQNNLAQLVDDSNFHFQILQCYSLQHKTSHNAEDKEEIQEANRISINVSVIYGIRSKQSHATRPLRLFARIGTSRSCQPIKLAKVLRDCYNWLLGYKPTL